MRFSSSSFLTIREHLRLSTPSSFQSSLWRIPSGFDWISFSASSTGSTTVPTFFCPSDNRCNGQNIVAPDNYRTKTPSPLVIDKLNRLVHMNVQVFINGNKTPLQFPAFVFDLDRYF